MVNRDQAAEMFLEELVLFVCGVIVRDVFRALEKKDRHAPDSIDHLTLSSKDLRLWGKIRGRNRYV